MLNTSNFLPLSSGIDYEFLDSGNSRKLERFGKYILNRPEVGADWNPLLEKQIWQSADWVFEEKEGKTGQWISRSAAPKEWDITYLHRQSSLTFHLRLTSFKHIGIFPEQAENWKFIQNELAKIDGEKKVLNLFAYTGAASMIAASCGALVSNIDSVKQVLNWGRDNAKNNDIDTIRWILEDARKFVEKSVRRGDVYHGIIMDPPIFGYGAKNEKWKLEKDLKALVENSIKLLKAKNGFFILNTYSPKLPMKELKSILDTINGFPKNYTSNTLGLESNKNQKLELGNLIRFSY